MAHKPNNAFDSCAGLFVSLPPQMRQDTVTAPRRRLPDWIRVRLPTAPTFYATDRLIDDLRLHTVCESARCPNRSECWSQGTATFMIAGDHCTRACRFCAVPTAKPLPLEDDEPHRVAEAVKRMRLKHVVITSVARDDLPDGGAEHFARTVRAIRAVCGDVVIEVLTPDFDGKREHLKVVLDAGPEVFNHNLETVRRLTPAVRFRFTYETSLAVLRMARELAPATYTKSGIMLGLGETDQEVIETMRDLRAVGCEILTIGQYLQPTAAHLPVREFVPPSRFAQYGRRALEMGFVHCASGPLVRSSYHAGDFSPRKT
jgi:lipoic acid synthetase